MASSYWKISSWGKNEKIKIENGALTIKENQRFLLLKYSQEQKDTKD